MECFNKDAYRRKKDTFDVHWGRAIQIATCSNLFDAKCEFYGFNDDLRDTII